MGNILARNTLPVFEEEISPALLNLKNVGSTTKKYLNLAATLLIIYVILFLLLFTMQIFILIKVK